MWLATRPNMLPVHPETGGLAAFVGWVDGADGTVEPSTAGAVVVDPDRIIATQQVLAGTAAPRLDAVGGRDYTAAVTADGWVIIAIRWVLTDGTVTGPVVSSGAGRVHVVGRAPASAEGIVVELVTARVRVVAEDDDTYTVEHWPLAGIGDWGILADPSGSDSPVTITDPVLVRGANDPGPRPPHLEDDSFGARLYAGLPSALRDDDRPGLVLRKFCDGVGAMDDPVVVVQTAISTGRLTDPHQTDTAWLPWLAGVTGTPWTAGDSSVVRQRIAQRLAVPAAGTAAALAEVARAYLTGARSVHVSPSSLDQWEILLIVREDEIGSGTEDSIAAAVTATGFVPAGHYVTVRVGTPTWAGIDSEFDEWADTEDKQWATIDSTGL